MATIFTVHGTFASGPEKGDQWWQKGSVFEQELKSYVVANDGEIGVEPVIWDGANSELSRRRAATYLLSKTNKAEVNGEHYALIGHSHGGSVILNAAIQSAQSRLFPKLGCIITVATPFIRFRKSRFLFNRVGLLGKSVMLTLFVTAAVGLHPFLPNTYENLSQLMRALYKGDLAQAESAGEFIIIMSSLLVPVAAAYTLLRTYNAVKFRRYRRSVITACRTHLDRRWLCLYDRNDEAVRGLGSVQKIRPRIFPARFAVPTLSFISIFLIPILLAIGTVAPDFSSTGRIASLTSQFTVGVVQLFYTLLPALVFRSYDFEQWFFDKTFIAAALLLLSFLVTAAATACAVGFSALLRPILDTITWSAIRKSLLGADAMGETGDHAVEHPEWMLAGFNYLPIELSNEINGFSDAEAAKSIPRLRNAIFELVNFDNLTNPNVSVAAYLTWKELVHTSY